MDVKLHQVCMNSDHMTQSVTAMLRIAKLTPHMRSHPHAQTYESDLLAGVKGESRFLDRQPCECWVKPSRGEST